jgi:hypothetical protein
MARLHTNVLHWGNKYEGPNTYKMGREGALEDAYWDEDELVDYRRKGGKKKRKPRRGCPGNEGKGHVYVWVTETVYGSKWNPNYGHWTNDFTKKYTYDTRRCCGCLKVDKSRRRR